MKQRQFYLSLIPFALLVLLGLWLYPVGVPREAALEKEAGVRGATLAVVSRDVAAEEERLARFLDFLNGFLVDEGLRLAPRVVNSPDALEAAIVSGEVDFYLDSAFAVYHFVEAGLVEPIARQWKDGIDEYHSVIVARRDSGIRDLSGLSGGTIAFEDPGSSSSFYLPYSELKRAGFTVIGEGKGLPSGPVPWVRYRFSGWDGDSLGWVLAGEAEAAAINSAFFDRLSGAEQAQLQVIHRSESIPRHILAAHTGLGETVQDAVLGLLLELERSEDGRAAMLAFNETRRFDLIPYERDLRARMLQKLAALPWNP